MLPLKERESLVNYFTNINFRKSDDGWARKIQNPTRQIIETKSFLLDGSCGNVSTTAPLKK